MKIVDLLKAAVFAFFLVSITGCNPTEIIGLDSDSSLEEINDESIVFDVIPGYRIIQVQVDPSQLEFENSLCRYEVLCFKGEKLVGKKVLLSGGIFEDRPLYFENLEADVEYTIKLVRYSCTESEGSVASFASQYVRSVTTKTIADKLQNFTVEFDQSNMTLIFYWDYARNCNQSYTLVYSMEGCSYVYGLKSAENLVVPGETHKFFIYSYFDSKKICSDTIEVTIPTEVKTEVMAQKGDYCVEISWMPFSTVLFDGNVQLYRNSITPENLVAENLITTSVVDTNVESGKEVSYILVLNDGEITDSTLKFTSEKFTPKFEGPKVYYKKDLSVVCSTTDITINWTPDTAASGYILSVFQKGKWFNISLDKNTTSYILTSPNYDVETGLSVCVQSIVNKEIGKIGDVITAVVNAE